MSSYVYRVDVSLPTSLAPCGEVFPSRTEGVPITLTYNSTPVGPLYVPANLAGPELTFTPPGSPMRMILWIKQQ